MSDSIAVDLQERSVVGKRLAGLRKQGLVPAVIHNHGKDSIHVMGDYIKLNKVYEQAGKHHPVEVTVGSKMHLALIKDADFEPTKRQLRHIVFQAIKQNEKVEAEIPVVLVGDIPAERKSLMVIRGTDTVIVDALPKDLPDELTADASVLEEVGDKLHVSDLKVPSNVTVLTEPETMLAFVEMPKDQLAEADAAAESLAEDATPGEDAEEPKAEATTEPAEEE